MTSNGRDVYRHEWQRALQFRKDIPLLLESFPKTTQLERKLLTRVLTLLGENFNIRFEAKPIEKFAEFPPDLWEPLTVASKLQELKIITHIEKQKMLSDEPKLFRYFVGVEGTRSSGQHGLGASFFSEVDALWAAIGEAVDRYSLIHFAPKWFRDAPYQQLVGQALDIFSLTGLSSERRAQEGFRHRLQFDETTVFRWVKGYSLTNARKILVPLQLITLYHWAQEEAILRVPVSTGNAVGRNLHEAIYRGMLEVIERDAFMITWLRKLSPPQLDLMGFPSPHVQQIVKMFERYRLELKVIVLPTDTPCHVILAVILDRVPKSVFLTLGMKASLNLEEAIIGAIQEALSSRLISRGLLPLGREELPELGEVEKIGRLERYRIWGSRPDLEPEIEFLWKGEAKSSTELNSYPFQELRGALEHLLEHFRRTGIEVVYVENIPEHIRGKIPLTSAYVIIPKFQPLHLTESLPYFYGERLHTVPQKLGYQPIQGINQIPHPFP